MSVLTAGLVGAGPWAEKVYAPMLSAGPETRLGCVWARRPEVARELASRFACDAAESFDALLDRCEAVAFAVPPDVQAELAVRAARAGRHLMLDKPLAITLDAAASVVEAVDVAGVVSQIMLTHRFRPKTASFLTDARRLDAKRARLAFLSNAFLRGPYANAWRREHGALHDLGPHAFDLLEAALGPIEEITGRGDPRTWVALVCGHAGGAVSEVVMSGIVDLERSVFRIELEGRGGSLVFDAVAAAVDEPWSLARRTFAEAVRARRPPELDARHGLRIQKLIDRALRGLR
jgi:predicted dehydrogenase